MIPVSLNRLLKNAHLLRFPHPSWLFEKEGKALKIRDGFVKSSAGKAREA